MDVILLKSTKFTLKLSSDSQKWCRVFLIASDQEYYLGADDKELILKRLFNALSQELDSPIGEINGVTLSGSLSLYEVHCTIYVGKINAERCLYFQDRDANIFANFPLSASDLEVWLSHLSDLKKGM